MRLFLPSLLGVWVSSTLITLLCVFGYSTNGDICGKTSMQYLFKLTPKALWETTIFNPVGSVLIWVIYVLVNPIILILLGISYMLKD